MVDSDSAPASLLTSLRGLADSALAALQNRVELLAVEFQEEKDHTVELLLWVVALLFFAILTVVVLTATIILVFPRDLRVYAAGALSLLYLLGAVWSFYGLRSRLKN